MASNHDIIALKRRIARVDILLKEKAALEATVAKLKEERHELTEYINKYIQLCVKLQQDKCSCKHENGVDTFEDITSVKQEMEGSHHQTPCSNSDSKIDEDKETKDLKQELQPPPDDYDYSWWCAWDDLI